MPIRPKLLLISTVLLLGLFTLHLSTSAGSLTPPGSGKSYTFTIRNGGIDTDWVCVVTGTVTATCSDTSGSTITSGQLAISSVPSGSPASEDPQCYIIYSVAL